MAAKARRLELARGIARDGTRVAPAVSIVWSGPGVVARPASLADGELLITDYVIERFSPTDPSQARTVDRVTRDASDYGRVFLTTCGKSARCCVRRVVRLCLSTPGQRISLPRPKARRRRRALVAGSASRAARVLLHMRPRAVDPAMLFAGVRFASGGAPLQSGYSSGVRILKRCFAKPAYSMARPAR